MPAHVEEDLTEGFSIQKNNGKYVMTRTFFVTDIPGLTAVEKLAAAESFTTDEGTHTGGDIPKDKAEFTINAQKVYANKFVTTPWGATDAQVVVTYDTNKRGDFDVPGFGPTIKEVGTSAEEQETDFDFINLNLPLASRERIRVDYDAAAAGAPGSAAKKVDARVRRFAPRTVLTFIREQTADPEAIAIAFVARTNSDTWRGHPPGTVLCFAIVGRDEGTGIWVTTYSFMVEPLGFKQYARYIVPETGQPPQLTTAQIAAQNGIKEVTVQGTAAFASLGMPA